VPVPRQRTAVTIMAGTGDPRMPYEARVIGPIPGHLDATGLLLDLATSPAGSFREMD